MAQVDNVPRGHPGPLTSPDELDKELDWLIENGTEENKVEDVQSNPTTPRSPQIKSENKTEMDSKKKIRKLDTAYPKSPSPRSSSPGSPPPSSPSHIHYADDEFEADDDNEVLTEPSSVDSDNGTNHKKSSDEDDENYEDDYEFSEDQKQAMMELQEMKIDLGYTEEDPPEYDVTERVRQLNEELAKDPTPGLEDGRERAIKFPENPVSQEIPPLDYTESSEEENHNKGQTEENQTAAETQDNNISQNSTKQNKMNENNDESRLVMPLYSNEHSDTEDDSKTKTTEKPSTKTEIGDEVLSDDENKEEVRSKSSASDNDDKPQSNSDESQTSKSRPKSGGPSRMRFKAVSVEIKDANDEDNDRDKKEKQQSGSEDDDEKVLVERNGQFELLKASDLTPEERQFYGVETEKDKEKLKKKDNDDKADSVKSSGSSKSSGSVSSNKFEPHPPRAPRPNTAAANNGGRRMASGKPRRAQSAKQYEQNDNDFNFDYTSPYAMTPEEKRQYQREQNEKKKQEKEEENEKKNKKEREKEEAEDAFRSWLSHKRQEAAKRREKEREEKKKEEEEQEKNKKDPDSAYKEWCDVKKEHIRKNRKIQEAQKREHEDGYSPRSRQTCNRAFNDDDDDSSLRGKDNGYQIDLKLDLYSETAPQLAFKAWLKKKNSVLRRQKLEEQSKNRVSRLMARRSRKSQQLAKAMTHANTFKYVDYYGYRC